MLDSGLITLYSKIVMAKVNRTFLGIKLPSKKQTVIVSIFVGVLVLVVVPSYYFYSQYQRSQKLLQNPTLGAQKEVEKLVERVGQLIELPKNEDPTIATVSDKNKLKDQEFFKNAENGDKVIIFQKSGKAIIYRPSINKIIEVSSINLSQQVDAGSPSPSLKAEEKKYKLVLYNATNISGLTKTVEADLKIKLPNTEVVQRGNAVGEYDKTLIVDLKGSQGEFAKTLAKELNAEIGGLPSGETEPEGADFLIILVSN